MTRLRQIVKFLGLVVRHPGIPRWARYGLAVLFLIPGPVDELLALPAIITLLIVRRAVIFECWEASK
jgi:hypothetical protein